MLKVNVGLSRKLSKDYNSTGYSINLEGEVTAPVSEPEAVVEQVKELYDVAEEALDQQIDRSQSVDSMANHDETRREPQPARRTGNGSATRNGNEARRSQGNPRGNGHGGEEQPATNKQIQYLLSIGKRMRMSTAQLERKVEEILGYPVGVYDLSKQAAGVAIDALTSGNGTRARQ
jgi:hypothetical protein